MIDLGHQYRVTSAAGSIEVWLDAHTIKNYADTPEKLREEVAHQAWRKLWESEAKTMLKGLCDRLGVDRVKSEFTKKITIQEIK